MKVTLRNWQVEQYRTAEGMYSCQLFAKRHNVSAIIRLSHTSLQLWINKINDWLNKPEMKWSIVKD